MRSHPIFSALALATILSTSAEAGTINTNLTTSFNLLGSFNEAIDTDVIPDAVLAAKRLFNTRLGEWQSTTSTLEYVHSYTISLNDPGVPVAPASDRPLLQVDTQATLSGTLVGASAATTSFSTPWHCPAGQLKCSSGLVGQSKPTATLINSSFANPNDVMGGFHVFTTAQTEALFPGTTLNSSQVKVAGSLKLATSYQAKTTQAYVTDAINATVGAPAASRTVRFGNAAADIAALRNGTYADSAVVSGVGDNVDLEAAHAALVYSRDSARLLAATTSGQTSFASRSHLLRNIWDVTALGDPTLGRSVADSTDDPFSPDHRVELAAFKAISNSSDDAGYLNQLGIELDTPLISSTQPMLILDGAQFGATGAELRIFFYDGNANGSDLILNLPAAERHVLMRAGFSNLAVLSGPEAGLAFISSSGDGVVTPGNSEYIGETFSGALLLDGDNAAWEIGLNNFYSPQFLVLASWNVTPVPEPETWLMLLAGLAMLGAQRRRRVAGT